MKIGGDHSCSHPWCAAVDGLLGHYMCLDMDKLTEIMVVEV